MQGVEHSPTYAQRNETGNGLWSSLPPIVERHPHQIKDFPSPDEDEPDGVDATVSEGWLDLKVKNSTDCTFQIEISIDGAYVYGRIFVDQTSGQRYEIINRDKSFFQKRRNNGTLRKQTRMSILGT